MKKLKVLKDILYKSGIRSIRGSTDIKVTDIQMDSRKVKPGTLFIAVKGTVTDGHQFIEQAVNAGAAVVVCEQLPVIQKEEVVYVQVENSAAAAGYIASQFFDRPSEKMKVVGVTGTNGKTTIATLLYKLFTSLGYRCGLISTVENRIGEKIFPATHTTPEAIQLNELLNKMAEDGCSHVFMENSSHAIHQHRTTGIHFSGAVFSNITHDHLDYHKTMDEYIRVKKSFFDSLPSSAFALSNADDKRGTVMLQNTLAKKYFYSLRAAADFKGKILENSLNGLVMQINNQEVHFRMIGEFNAYNLLAVFGAAICLGEEKQEILRCLSVLTGAEGRFDYLISPHDKIIAIVDYAHTPDALLNVLATLKKLRRGHEQIITVVGCGGDRDKKKRPIMAEVACEYSNKVILTSDNPRSEDPMQIIQDMEKGVNLVVRKNCLSIVDRREAIKTAVTLARAEDILLVAGKGHEKYQEIKGVKYYFDDKEVIKEMFELMGR